MAVDGNFMAPWSSMSTSTGERAQLDLAAEEAAIRERLEEWIRAVRRHDLDGVIAYHDSHLRCFDVAPASQVHGLSAYRDLWPPFFEFLGSTGRFELTEIQIVAGTDVAFAHGILVVRGERDDRVAHVRLTVGLRKAADAWWITHEHHSAPYTG